MELDLSSTRIEIQSQGIVPLEFNTGLLKELEIIADKSEIDDRFFRNTTIGSHILLNDNSRTSIDASYTSIKIKSNTNKAVEIYSKIIGKFTDLEITSVAIGSTYHIDDNDVVYKTLKSKQSSEVMECSLLRFQKDHFSIVIYECSENRLHINLESKREFDMDQKFENSIPLSNISEESNKLLSDLFSQEFKIKLEDHVRIND